MQPIDILLVEDNPGDVRLIQAVLRDQNIPNRMMVASDGAVALDRLADLADILELPDIIILDLNLPRMNGHEVLAVLKNDAGLKHIPVIILTTSRASEDINAAYQQHANCYITKPDDITAFIEIVRTIEAFWFKAATLPTNRRGM